MTTGKQKRAVYFTIGGQAIPSDMGRKVTPKNYSKRGFGRKLNSEKQTEEWLRSFGVKVQER